MIQSLSEPFHYHFFSLYLMLISISISGMNLSQTGVKTLTNALVELMAVRLNVPIQREASSVPALMDFDSAATKRLVKTSTSVTKKTTAREPMVALIYWAVSSVPARVGKSCMRDLGVKTGIWVSWLECGP